MKIKGVSGEGWPQIFMTYRYERKERNMTWTVLERVALPQFEKRPVWKDIEDYVATGESIIKEPGDKITKAEMAEAQQTAEDIQSLIDHKAIEEDA